MCSGRGEKSRDKLLVFYYALKATGLPTLAEGARMILVEMGVTDLVGTGIIDISSDEIEDGVQVEDIGGEVREGDVCGEMKIENDDDGEVNEVGDKVKEDNDGEVKKDIVFETKDDVISDEMKEEVCHWW